MRILVGAALCGWIVVLGACAPQGQQEGEAAADREMTPPTPEVVEEEVPGTGQTGDLSPLDAETRVDDVEIGRAVGPDGAIMEGESASSFAPGEAVHASMEVGDTPAGSAVKVVWYGPDDVRLGEETKTVEAGQGRMSFQLPATGAVEHGDYRVEVWIGDENVASESFEIGEAEDAPR